MLNFGASKTRVKGGIRAPGTPPNPHLLSGCNKTEQNLLFVFFPLSFPYSNLFVDAFYEYFTGPNINPILLISMQFSVKSHAKNRLPSPGADISLGNLGSTTGALN